MSDIDLRALTAMARGQKAVEDRSVFLNVSRLHRTAPTRSSTPPTRAPPRRVTRARTRARARNCLLTPALRARARM